MPYTIRKVPKKNCYRVTNTKTKRVFAHCASKKHAESQVRLLRAVENNKNFVLRPEKRRVTRKVRRVTKSQNSK
jgi:hypothetical protein